MRCRGWLLCLMIFALSAAASPNAVAQSTWNTDTGGPWHQEANWLGPIPDAQAAAAVFGPTKPAGGSTILLDGSVTLGTLGLAVPGGLQFDADAAHPASILIFNNGAAEAMLRAFVSGSSPQIDFNVPLRLDGNLNVSQTGVGGSAVFNFHAPISGNGGITFSANTYLHAANTYTGHTTIDGGDIYLWGGDSTLGTGGAGTTVNGGRLIIDSPLDESIAVRGGTVLLRNAAGTSPVTIDSGGVELADEYGSYQQQITVTSGWLAAHISFADMVVANPVVLQGGTLRLLGDTSFTHQLVFDAGFAGAGRLVLDDSLAVAVRQPLAAALDLEVNAGEFHFDMPSTFAGTLTLHRNGQLHINADTTLENVASTEGSIYSTPDATLTLPGAVHELGQWTDANLAGPTSIVKRGRDRTYVTNIGPANDAAVSVEEGLLIAQGEHAFGSSVGITTVAAAENAAIFLDGGFTTPETIDLNNATGFGGNGALRVDLPTSQSVNSTVHVGGVVLLGDTGSVIGGRGTLFLDGGTAGGDLAKVGPNTVFLTAPGEHEGVTHVREGKLILTHAGTLPQNERVIVESGATLDLDNGGSQAPLGQTIVDRISPATPVELRGGRLRILGDATTVAGERVNTVRQEVSEVIVSGAAEVEVSIDRLQIQRLSREVGGTLVIPATEDRVKLVELPVLDDGILGGWAGDEHGFVSLDGSFLRYLPENQCLPTLAGAGQHDNVALRGAETLVSDAHVNALWFVDTPAAKNIDLGGHTLTVDTGGLLGSAAISNGWLTAGTGGPAELYLPGGTVSANIVDNSDGPVTVVASTKSISLSGTNTYSGGTIIHEADVEVRAAAALPAGLPILIDGQGGELAVLATDAPTHPGVITLRNGWLSAPGAARIDADGYMVERGGISGGLMGNGSMSKLTAGVVRLTSDLPDYHGAIDIYAGALVAEDDQAIGMGVTTIHDGGLLASPQRGLRGQIVLNGGAVAGLFHADATLSVVAPSVLGAADSNSAWGNFYRTEVDGTLSGDADLTLRGGMVLSADNVALTGAVSVQAWDYEVEVFHRRALGSGTATVHSGAVWARTADGRIDVSDLVLDGGELWLPNNGRLQGNLINLASQFSPGSMIRNNNPVGWTTVTGDFEQASEAIFQVEISGFGYQLFDRLAVGGLASLDGVLKVVLMDGFTPQATDIFPIIVASGVSGIFANAPDQIFTGSGWFDVVYRDTQVQLTNFVPIPEPTALLVVCAAAIFLSRRPHGRGI